MVTKVRSTFGMAAIWLAAVAGVSATAWVAIDRAGRDITDVNVSSMPPVPLNTPTVGSEPTNTATPTLTSPATSPTSVPTTPATSPHPASSPPPAPTAAPAPAPTPAPAPLPPPAAPTPQDLTTRVTGGFVSVRCTGTTITLGSAQPENDWRVHVDTSIAGQIAVSFSRGDEEDRSRTQVTAVCTNGTPVFTVNNG